MVALDTFTELNGATVVVPKSHLWDEKRWPDRKEAFPVTMDSGSMVYFLGTLWHGGGQNTSETERKALNMQYCQPWMRPFENHILAVDWGKLGEIPLKVVDMMGYKVGTPFIGSVEGGSPLRAVTRRLKDYRSGIEKNTKL
jgi:ectoine hydroxylase-related dioxygenase (phytanoyl-CoA dioxygenase family)